MNNPLFDIWKKTSSFLFSNLNKQLLVFLFFLALSSIFWLLMTLNESYEQEIAVPVEITQVPKNVVITSELTDTLHVTLHDKGYALLSYASKLHDPIEISFSQYANTSTGKGSIPVSNLQKVIAGKLLASTQIVSIKPEKLEFTFNYGESKRVPIRLQGYVVPAENYYLAQTTFAPESVLVYGNRQDLDTLDCVYTEFLEARNFEDTLSQEVYLKSLRGMKIMPRRVKVTFHADILTEESIEVPVTAVNVPEGKGFRFFPSKVKVNFQVGARKVRTLKPQHFSVVADCKEIIKNPAEKCNIRLRTAPNIVLNPRLEVGQVDYIIEQR